MRSAYTSKELNKIWSDFTAHFQSETTAATYQADICECMEYTEKDFLKVTEADAQGYFQWLKRRVESGKLQPGTMAKKLRELHSFAEYICERREQYEIPKGFSDGFAPLLKLAASQEKYVRTIPVEHIDRLLKCAEEDRMAYTILVMLYRVGLSSTEVIALKPEDFGAYDNGVYVKVAGRMERCFVPEDAFLVLEQYLQEREPYETLFYNRRGNPLNLMYISRLMKKYTTQAGVPSYSAENLRNACGATMFAYGARPEQVAQQMGITTMQVERYHNISYKENLQRAANQLVKLKVEPPQ